MKRIIFTLSLCLFCIIGKISAQTYSGGSGTQTLPYLISTKADMVALSNAVDGGTTYSGKYFLLTTDLIGSNAVTTSIGSYNSRAFSGIFDGGNHEIELSNAPNGVFGYLSGATVQNLGVKGTVTASSSDDSYAGGVCGRASNATIIYCYNSATITSATTSSSLNMSYSSYVGGICGYAESSNSISNCYNLGNITASASDYPHSSFTGGICGYAPSYSISNCYNLGNITASAYYSFSGGICGYGGIINNCFAANSAITASNYSDDYAGRISRYNYDGTVSNCYALSTMTINGATVSSTNENSKDGNGVAFSSFQSQTWIENNLGWDFNTVWEMSSGSSENKGLPILKSGANPVNYTITASSGNNGSISPSGKVTVNQGGSQTFTFTPAVGFVINQVLVDRSNNSSAVSSGSYTFTDVTINHTISVSFRLATLPTYSGGNGSKATPYLISSKADMEALANAVVYGGSSGTTYSGKYFQLTTDLIGSNAVTTSIGSYNSRAFSGIFDGGNHEIELSNAPNGVFGYLTGATVQNLGVKGTVTASSSSSYAGGICGRASNATIIYCYNSAAVTSSSSSSRSFASAGGICGYAESSNSISNCYNLGAISSSSSCNSYSSVPSSNSYAGGICGYSDYNYSLSSLISNCYNLGSITAASSDSSYGAPYSYVGGICGDGGTINNCFAANSVITATRNGNNSGDVGRISGRDGTVSNCYALSTMTINGSAVNSTDANSKDGNGVAFSSFQSQTWIENNLGWDFDTVWKMSSSSSDNKGLPILKRKQYTIAVSAGSGGSITPNSSVTVEEGDNQTFTFTPNLGYEINQVVINGANNATAVSTGSYTFTNVTDNCSIIVSFKQKQYLISVATGNGGNISPSFNQTVTYGSSKTFTFTPNTGYKINQVIIDNENDLDAVAAGNYTFTNITENHTISVSFIKQYTIAASAGSNGSLVPSGNIIVSQGSSQTFTFLPDIGYEIDQVVIDNINDETAVATTNYTFTNITADHTISVTFKQKIYSITVLSGTNGSISPSSNQTVTYGSSNTFTFTPNTGYEIDQVVIDGDNNIAAVAAGSYTFSNVTENHSISVSFKQKQYTIIVSAGNGGSISPSSNKIVTYGNDQTFTFTPNIGYEIDQVLIDGMNNTTAVSTGSYTFSNVTANYTISVLFKQKQYAIIVSVGSGGSILPSSNQTVLHGNSQTFTFTPNTGYEIDQVLINGVNNPVAVSAGSYTFTNVIISQTISVSFKIKQYTVALSSGTGGTILPSGNQIVNHGGSRTFNFYPDDGYEIYQVLVDGENSASAISNRSYTFTNVTANHSIYVRFGPICQPNLVTQVWDDVLLVNNNPASNGGYTFVSYQWQKNEVNLSGETSGSLYFGNGNLDVNAEYSVLLTTSDGQHLQSCPVRLQAGNVILRSYPNPTSGIVTIENANIQAGDKIEIFNTYGQLMQQSSAEKNQTTLDLSSLPKGTYILQVNKKQIKVIKN